MELSLKQPLVKLGFNGKLLAHIMVWMNEPNHIHRVNRYRSDSPWTIKAQLDTMQAVGIDGVIVTWQGSTVSPMQTRAAQMLCEQCEVRGMTFVLLLDPWLVKGRALTSVTPVQEVIARLTDPGVVAMLNSPAYVPEKYVLEFDLSAAGVMGANVVDFAPVQAALPNIKILSKHKGYSWPELTNTIPTLALDNKNPNMQIPGITPQFNDAGNPTPVGVSQSAWTGSRDYGHSVWDSTLPSRVIDHQAGNFYLDQIAVTPMSSNYIAIATWNDADEGTDIERFCSMLTGIRIAGQ